MNWKPTWVLLAAAAVLLAYIVLVEHPLRRQRERQASRVILPGLNPRMVTNIEIHPWGAPLIQAARQGKNMAAWSLLKPVAYAAQSQHITNLLTLLSKMEWVDRLTEKDLVDRPFAQEESGFTKPRFTLLLQGSGSDRRLEIGNLGTFNDTISMQVVGDNSIYQIPSDLLRWIPTDNKYWRDRELLNVMNLSFQTLRVRAAGKEFELARDATNHLWFMRKPQARADTPKINDLLSNLQNVVVSDFVTDNPPAEPETYGLQTTETTPGLVLSFLDGTNRIAGLEVGVSVTNLPGAPTNFPPQVYVRRDNTGNIVIAPKNAFKPWEAVYTNFLDQHFISLSPSLVQSITVQGVDNFEVRKQTNGQWLVKGAQSFPADSMLMEYWLAGLTNVPTEMVKTVVTDFTPYGLSNACLQYAVRFSPGAGAPNEARICFGTNASGQVFERRLDEDFVNTISTDDFSVLPRVSWELRDRQVWNFASSNVVSVIVYQLGATNKYLRDPDGNWTYAPGYGNPVPVNSAATEECVFRIGKLHAVYWDGVGETNLERFGFAKTDHQLEFTVKRGGTNEVYRLQFGAKSPQLHPYACVMRDGQRLIFEFPADLYENLVEPNLTLYTTRLHYR